MHGVCDLHLHERDAKSIAAVPQQSLAFRECLIVECNSIDLSLTKAVKKNFINETWFEITSINEKEK